jgi:hypothetical protein
MGKATIVGFKTEPVDQDLESSSHQIDMVLKIASHAIPSFLGMSKTLSALTELF